MSTVLVLAVCQAVSGTPCTLDSADLQKVGFRTEASTEQCEADKVIVVGKRGAPPENMGFYCTEATPKDDWIPQTFGLND